MDTALSTAVEEDGDLGFNLNDLPAPRLRYDARSGRFTISTDPDFDASSIEVYVLRKQPDSRVYFDPNDLGTVLCRSKDALLPDDPEQARTINAGPTCGDGCRFGAWTGSPGARIKPICGLQWNLALACQADDESVFPLLFSARGTSILAIRALGTALEKARRSPTG